MDHTDIDRREKGLELGIPKLATTYLRQLTDVFVKNGTISSLSDQPGDYHLARDWHWDELQRPAAFAELTEKLEQLDPPRLAGGDAAVRILVSHYLFERKQSPTVAHVVRRWFRGINATRWKRYQAVGFEHLIVDTPLRLTPSIMLLPGTRMNLPDLWTLDESSVWHLHNVRAWAVLSETTSSRFPDASIAHYPFPESLQDTFAVLFTPLLRPTHSAYWDGPVPVELPMIIEHESVSLSGAVRVSKSHATELRRVYRESTARRGTGFWQGSNGFPEKGDRVGTAVSYLVDAGVNVNVFRSCVALATCLEALVGQQGPEISHRVSERTALLAGTDDDDCWDIWNHARALYDLRSKLLHEGNVMRKGAAQVRRTMVPPHAAPNRSISGRDFMAPFHVSVEITRRAVRSAWILERRAGDPFNPSRLDKALFRAAHRRKLRSFIRRPADIPVREFVASTLAEDRLRLSSLTPTDSP